MKRLSFLCADFERNPVYTPWMFAGALASSYAVELVGPRPRRIWPPAEDELAAVRFLPGASPLRNRVREAAVQATEGTAGIYAFKPMAASFGLGLWLRRRLDVPLVLHMCDWDGGYFSHSPPLRRAWYAARGAGTLNNEPYIRLLERRVGDAELLTVSTRALQRRFGGHIVRQGVDCDRFSPERFPRPAARERVGVELAVPLVAFLGTPSLHKGVGDLIGAFRELSTDIRGKLLIVGSPPDADSARVLAAADGKCGVEVRSSVPFSEAPWYMAAADVLCAPQRPSQFAQHQLPAKVLHWMAMGACIVTTAVGDAEEILGGAPSAGQVVPPLDRAALRDVLAGLLADGELRLSLGREARKRAEQLYSWRAMSRELIDLLHGIGV